MVFITALHRLSPETRLYCETQHSTPNLPNLFLKQGTNPPPPLLAPYAKLEKTLHYELGLWEGVVDLLSVIWQAKDIFVISRRIGGRHSCPCYSININHRRKVSSILYQSYQHWLKTHAFSKISLNVFFCTPVNKQVSKVVYICRSSWRRRSGFNEDWIQERS